MKEKTKMNPHTRIALNVLDLTMGGGGGGGGGWGVGGGGGGVEPIKAVGTRVYPTAEDKVIFKV